MLGVGFIIIAGFVFYNEKKYLEKVERRRQARKKTEEIFDEITEDHGELFEISKRPMNREEYLILSKDVRLGKIIGITAAVIFFIASILIYLEGITGFSVVLGFCFLVSLIGTFFAISQGKNWKRKKSIHILKGVITNKEISEIRTKIHEISVSKRIIIQVDRTQFEKLKLGDIVSVESVSSSFHYKPVIKVLGNIEEESFNSPVG